MKSKKKNQIYVVLSTSIVLFFIGLYVLSIFHSGGLTRMLKEQVIHVIELKSGDQADSVTLLQTVKGRDDIITSSVQLMKNEEALKIMANEIDTALINTAENPFLDVITFRSTADANTKTLHTDIEAMPAVESVYAQEIQFDQIKKNIGKLGLVFLIAAGLFSILALALIFSTLQLQLYADRFEIKTMELVGAHDRFIKMPYLRRAVILATRATINAAIFLTIIFLLMKYSWVQASTMLQFSWLLLTFLILWILGVLFLWMSSNYLIQKFLSKHLNELYT